MTPDELKKVLAQNPELTVREYGNRKNAVPVASVTQVTTVTNPLAQKFEALWSEWDGPELVKEYRFDSVRRWKIDYFHEPTRCGLELEGGIYSAGRHSRPAGYKSDCEKYNHAGMRGITVFRLATGMVTPENVAEIADYLNKKAKGVA